MPACPTCGFDPTSVSPSDAAVALRSFPRRFRALVTPDPGDEQDDVPGGEPSGAPGAADDAPRRQSAALAEVGQAAAAIAEIGADLRAVLVNDTPVLSTTGATATEARSAGDPATALDRLTTSTSEVADLADQHRGEAWARSGTGATGPIKASQLLGEAVHAGVHHLREAGGSA